MSAAGVLLNCRNQKLSAVQTMSALQIKRSGAGSKAFERLNHRFLSVSYKTCLSVQNQLGVDFDSQVLEWKNQVESEYKDEAMSGSRTARKHPGYRLVGDNVDIIIKPRQTSIAHASIDLHYFNFMAVKNRVSGNHLSKTRDETKLKEPVDWSQVVPSVNDHKRLESHWAILVGHIICRHIPALQWMQLYLPQHIPHDYSNETKKKSEVVRFYVLQVECSRAMFLNLGSVKFIWGSVRAKGSAGGL